jgi:hypothetical protein
LDSHKQTVSEVSVEEYYLSYQGGGQKK